MLHQHRFFHGKLKNTEQVPKNVIRYQYFIISIVYQYFYSAHTEEYSVSLQNTDAGTEIPNFIQQYQLYCTAIVSLRKFSKGCYLCKLIALRVQYKMCFRVYYRRLILLLGYFTVNSIECTLHVSQGSHIER